MGPPPLWLCEGRGRRNAPLPPSAVRVTDWPPTGGFKSSGSGWCCTAPHCPAPVGCDCYQPPPPPRLCPGVRFRGVLMLEMKGRASGLRSGGQRCFFWFQASCGALVLWYGTTLKSRFDYLLNTWNTKKSIIKRFVFTLFGAILSS